MSGQPEMAVPLKCIHLGGDVGTHGYGLGAHWLQGYAALAVLVFQGGTYEGCE